MEVGNRESVSGLIWAGQHSLWVLGGEQRTSSGSSQHLWVSNCTSEPPPPPQATRNLQAVAAGAQERGTGLAQTLPVPQRILADPALSSPVLACGRFVWVLREPGWASGHLSSCPMQQNHLLLELQAPGAGRGWSWPVEAVAGELTGGPGQPFLSSSQTTGP